MKWLVVSGENVDHRKKWSDVKVSDRSVLGAETGGRWDSTSFIPEHSQA